MKISEKWLREWVSPRLDTRAMAQCLTLAGLEVGGVSPAAPNMQHVVVGRIETVGAHPNAERVRVCKVNAGKRTLTIVSGAPDLVVGSKVAVALAGAMVAGERRIERSAIQGIESDGMLCSAADLGLEKTTSAVLVPGGEARAGQTLSDCLALDDSVLEIELTPNRGDCMSVAGIAREVAALTGARLRPVAHKTVAPRNRERRAVRLRT